MDKIYLKMYWTNHVLVIRKGGKKTYRDEKHSEIVEASELLEQVLRRVRKRFKNDKKRVEAAYNLFWATVNKTNKNGSKEKFSILDGERPMFTVQVAPVKLQFDLDGCIYIVKADKGLVRVGGSLKAPTGTSGIAYSGMSDKAAAANNIKRSTVDNAEFTAYTLDKIEAKVEEAKKNDAPPFSVVPEKGKGNAKTKQKDSGKPKQAKQQSNAKPRMGMTKPTVNKPDASKTGKKLTKRQLNECEKFKLDPDNLPADKPKGMNNKVWKAIQ